jgi:hypothetical protein
MGDLRNSWNMLANAGRASSTRSRFRWPVALVCPECAATGDTRLPWSLRALRLCPGSMHDSLLHLAKSAARLPVRSYLHVLQ